MSLYPQKTPAPNAIFQLRKRRPKEGYSQRHAVLGPHCMHTRQVWNQTLVSGECQP